MPLLLSLHLRQRSEYDRPRGLVFLQVDQQLAEGPRLRVAQNVPIRSATPSNGLRFVTKRTRGSQRFVQSLSPTQPSKAANDQERPSTHARQPWRTLDAPSEIERTTDRTCRAVERGVEAVAGRVVLHATPSLNCFPNDRMVSLNQVLPCAVTQRGLSLG
jgi:hypothetical protein